MSILALIGALTLAPAMVHGADCTSVLIGGRAYRVVPDQRIAFHTEFHFAIEDLQNDFSATAELVDGRLHLDFNLVNHRKRTRSPWRGSDLYGQVITHFGADKIRVIQALWLMGDNWETYFDLRRGGVDPKTAAKATWSGRQAAKYGFTEVRSIQEDVSEHGLPTTVAVEFSRPLAEKSGPLQWVKSPQVFLVKDLEYGFLFLATLRKGRLEIVSELTNETQGIRSSLRGQDLYRQAIENFGLQNIEVIAGRWYAGVNYDQFQEMKLRGFENEPAALQTWSGRQARTFGFSKVGRFETAQRDGKEAYVVEFTRP